jgi:hypothetical protein
MPSVLSEDISLYPRLRERIDFNFRKGSVLVKQVGYNSLIYESYGISVVESLTMMQLLEHFTPHHG